MYWRDLTATPTAAVLCCAVLCAVLTGIQLFAEDSIRLRESCVCRIDPIPFGPTSHPTGESPVSNSFVSTFSVSTTLRVSGSQPKMGFFRKIKTRILPDYPGRMVAEWPKWPLGTEYFGQPSGH